MGAPCAQTSILLLLPAVMENTHHGRVEDVSVRWVVVRENLLEACGQGLWEACKELGL